MQVINYFLITLIFFSCSAGVSQDKAQPAGEPVVLTSSPVNLKYFYVGIVNPLEVTVEGIDWSEVIVEVDKGSIAPDGEKKGRFLVTVTEFGSTLVKVYRNTPSGKEKLKTVKWLVMELPDPVIAFDNGETGGGISKKELLNLKGIMTLWEDFPIPVEFSITSFKLVVESGGADHEIAVEGDRFTEEALNLLAGARSNDIIIIDQVIVNGPVGEPHMMPGPQVWVE